MTPSTARGFMRSSACEKSSGGTDTRRLARMDGDALGSVAARSFCAWVEGQDVVTDVLPSRGSPIPEYFASVRRIFKISIPCDVTCRRDLPTSYAELDTHLAMVQRNRTGELCRKRSRHALIVMEQEPYREGSRARKHGKVPMAAHRGKPSRDAAGTVVRPLIACSMNLRVASRIRTVAHQLQHHHAGPALRIRERRRARLARDEQDQHDTEHREGAAPPL